MAVNFGRVALVESDTGEVVECVVRGRRATPAPVCGDRVEWTPLAGNRGVIESIAAREGLLLRHDPRRGSRPLAANVTRVMITCAVAPPPDPALIDRYTVATEALGIPALIVCNKMDMAEAAAPQLEDFEALDYPLVAVSAHTGAGMDNLRRHLADQCSVFVGPSGVGKSSLIETLLPDLSLRTAALSIRSGQGRHTTTATRRYPLPEDGGAIIDSPGVRDFRLWPLAVPEIGWAFREFRPYLGQCRFHNCSHREEPGCAVRAALDAGAIGDRRYASYRLLLDRAGSQNRESRSL